MAGRGRSRRSQPRPGVLRVWRLLGRRNRQSGHGGRSAGAGGQSRGGSVVSGRPGRGCRNSGWRVCKGGVSAEGTGGDAAAD